jgi:transcriptional regulator with XRE-family HTH domain
MNKQVEAVHSVGRPTMKDVASKAGVALKTVSRVVNGEAGVTPETAKRVQGAIEDLGFRRNESARLLRTGQTATLGFIADDWTNSDQAASTEGSRTSPGPTATCCIRARPTATRSARSSSRWRCAPAGWTG